MVEGCWVYRSVPTWREIVTILNEMAEYLTVPQMKNYRK